MDELSCCQHQNRDKYGTLILYLPSFKVKIDTPNAYGGLIDIWLKDLFSPQV